MTEIVIALLTVQAAFMGGAVVAWVHVEHRLTRIETLLIPK
jgi:hypothetical protein